MQILVLNCGSSSLKFRLFQMPEQLVLARGLVERIGDRDTALVLDREGLGKESHPETTRRPCRAPDHESAAALMLESLADARPRRRIDRIGAVGHRVVHGGEVFTGSVLINDEVISSIERFADLAPLHNPPNLIGIRAVRKKLPDTPQVACFDTAFHATIPPVAHLYALPYELYEKFGIRRYGFHGTSHQYVAQRAAEMLGRQRDEIDCITCHLGNGSSITAVKGGRSIDTSMGLTPLEGVPMGTRSGDFDPAVLFHLADKGFDVPALQTLCNQRSGLLGLSGTSNDMRTLEKLARDGDKRAALAIHVFCYRITKYIGAYTAVLGTVHALVFTGGIGENAADVRAGICRGLDSLGIRIDPRRNQAIVATEGDISTDESPVRALVIPTDEEGAIATETYRVVAGE